MRSIGYTFALIHPSTPQPWVATRRPAQWKYSFTRLSLCENNRFRQMHFDRWSYPIIYSIKNGTEKLSRYNTCHKHLTIELSNNPGSYGSCASDVYTFGYNFDPIRCYVKNSRLGKIVSFMMTSLPEARSELSQVLLELSKLK